MVLIQYAKCSTCKKAAGWLKEHNIAYEDRPIKEKNPAREELAEWYRRSGLPLKSSSNNILLAVPGIFKAMAAGSTVTMAPATGR